MPFFANNRRFCRFAADGKQVRHARKLELHQHGTGNRKRKHSDAAEQLELLARRITDGITRRLTAEQQRLDLLARRMPAAYTLRKAAEEHRLDLRWNRMRTAVRTLLAEQRHRLEMAEKVLAGASPDVILRRGYSITYAPDGHAARHAADLREGDILLTRLAEGEVRSTVISGKMKNEE